MRRLFWRAQSYFGHCLGCYSFRGAPTRLLDYLFQFGQFFGSFCRLESNSLHFSCFQFDCAGLVAFAASVTSRQLCLQTLLMFRKTRRIGIRIQFEPVLSLVKQWWHAQLLMWKYRCCLASQILLKRLSVFRRLVSHKQLREHVIV